MDMTDDHRVWARSIDVRDGRDIGLGQHVVVGDDDGEPSAARVVAVDGELILLEVLDGGVDVTSTCFPH